VDEIGTFLPVNPCNAEQCSEIPDRVCSGSIEIDSPHLKSCSPDALTLPTGARGYDDVVAGLARSDRELQPVQDEVPVFRYQEQKLPAGLVR
jgi:hypothetical protein